MSDFPSTLSMPRVMTSTPLVNAPPRFSIRTLPSEGDGAFSEEEIEVLGLDEVSDIRRKSAVVEQPKVTARQRKPKSSLSSVGTNQTGPRQRLGVQDIGRDVMETDKHRTPDRTAAGAGVRLSFRESRKSAKMSLLEVDVDSTPRRDPSVYDIAGTTELDDSLDGTLTNMEPEKGTQSVASKITAAKQSEKNPKSSASGVAMKKAKTTKGRRPADITNVHSSSESLPNVEAKAATQRADGEKNAKKKSRNNGKNFASAANKKQATKSVNRLRLREASSTQNAPECVPHVEADNITENVQHDQRRAKKVQKKNTRSSEAAVDNASKTGVSSSSQNMKASPTNLETDRLTRKSANKSTKSSVPAADQKRLSVASSLPDSQTSELHRSKLDEEVEPKRRRLSTRGEKAKSSRQSDVEPNDVEPDDETPRSSKPDSVSRKVTVDDDPCPPAESSTSNCAASVKKLRRRRTRLHLLGSARCRRQKKIAKRPTVCDQEKSTEGKL